MATEAQYRKRGYSADRAHARAMSDYYEDRMRYLTEPQVAAGRAVNASRYRDSGRRIPRGDWQPRDRRGRFVKMRPLMRSILLSEE